MASKYYHIAQQMIGTTIGRWLVLRLSDDGGRHVSMICRCACGAEKNVRVSKLHAGESKSCGCLRNDNLVTHGMTRSTNKKESREYWVWNSMKNRCLNPKYKHFSDYGGRGITVCDRWLDFNNFYSDMGPAAKGMTLERINNSAGYSPENCRWADRTTNNRNKRNSRMITANGETLNLSEWAARSGLTHSAILHRIKRGWPEYLAVTAARRYN